MKTVENKTFMYVLRIQKCLPGITKRRRVKNLAALTAFLTYAIKKASFCWRGFRYLLRYFPFFRLLKNIKFTLLNHKNVKTCAAGYEQIS